MKWNRCTIGSSRLVLSLIVGATLWSAGCATTQSAGDTEATAEATEQSADTQPVRTHENLNTVVWMQTSGEYDALTRQAYNTARLQLERALEDKGWTAALEQTKDYRDKPPAVILDVDETVLDNSPYQAKLIEQGESYSTETWNAWCRKAKAPAVPGAVEFTQYAADKGVTVFYLTNREHEVEEETRQNLRKLGFPLAEGRDVILTKYEKDAWDGSKTPRRNFVARDFRITLLGGDNLGDFMPDPEVSAADRADKAASYADRWGRSWIVVPNPAYGHWEGAVLDYKWGKSREQKLQDKRDALTTPDDL